MRAIDNEFFNGCKFYDAKRKESFMRRLDSNNIKYTLVENRRRIDHESIEFTEKEELVLIGEDNQDRAFKLFIPPDIAYPFEYLFKNVDATKWTYAEYTDHNKQVSYVSEARIAANDNSGVIGFSCSHHSENYNKPYFCFRYNIEPLYIASAKKAKVTLSTENHPPYNASLQIIDYRLVKVVNAHGIRQSKITNFIENDSTLKYHIEAEDQNLTVKGEVSLNNFKESISGMLDSCKRNQL